MKKIKLILPIVIMTVLITVSSIYTKQSFLRIIPLYVSLVIMVLQARVNRYAYLIGSINALIYGAIFIYYTLYGLAANALLMSFPLQVVTFIIWKKRAYKQSVVFRELSKKWRIIIAVASVVSIAVCYFILVKMKSASPFLESVTNIVGIVATVFTMLAYIEFSYLMVLNCAASVILYIIMTLKDPEQLPYLLYNAYALICVSVQFVNSHKLYKTQKNEVV